MRTCKDCGEAKPPTEFYEYRGRRQTTCKVCWRARVKLRRLTDPKVREYDRKRAKLPHRRAKQRSINVAWRADNPDGYRAQTALNNAVRDGKLERKPCEICASTTSVHGHHKDYAKPLDVIWLCARCHHRLHALFPEMEGANKRQESA